MNENMKKMI